MPVLSLFIIEFRLLRLIMATNGGQRFNFCNNCGTANIKVDVNTGTIISEGKQEPVPGTYIFSVISLNLYYISLIFI